MNRIVYAEQSLIERSALIIPSSFTLNGQEETMLLMVAGRPQEYLLRSA
ncbi:hypothetical protein [Propionivibrio sp.]